MVVEAYYRADANAVMAAYSFGFPVKILKICTYLPDSAVSVFYYVYIGNSTTNGYRAHQHMFINTVNIQNERYRTTDIPGVVTDSIYLYQPTNGINTGVIIYYEKVDPRPIVRSPIIVDQKKV